MKTLSRFVALFLLTKVITCAEEPRTASDSTLRSAILGTWVKIRPDVPNEIYGEDTFRADGVMVGSQYVWPEGKSEEKDALPFAIGAKWKIEGSELLMWDYWSKPKGIYKAGTSTKNGIVKLTKDLLILSVPGSDHNIIRKRKGANQPSEPTTPNGRGLP